MDLALRCNLVTLSNEPNYPDKTMLDYSAGEISSAESSQLIEALQEELNSPEFHFYPGISYRHLLVWKGGRDKQVFLTPPHDISGQVIAGHLPDGSGSPALQDLMQRSVEILANHPVNKSRAESGQSPATSVWFWGEGSKPSLDLFSKRYNLSGSVIGAVDLVRGLGICAGLKVVRVPGATGGIETNFAGKARAALDELKQGQDFVYLHIESPDEAGHQGSLKKKIWSIEEIDKHVLGLIRKEMHEFSDFRLLLLPDHRTPIAIKTHSSEPVPFMIFDLNHPFSNGPGTYDEEAAAAGPFIADGHLLMGCFINGLL